MIASAAKMQKLHPIIMLDYVVRLIGQTSVVGIMACTIYTEGNRNWIPYFLALIQAFVWPHVALYLSIRSKQPKDLELKFLLIDSFFIGCWIAYCNFALISSSIVFCCIIMAHFSIQGFNLAIKGIITTIIGLAIVLVFHGIHYSPQTNLFPIIISLLFLFVYTWTMGYFTYIRAAALKETKYKLRSAYHELENLNRIIQAASSSLDIDQIMEQISAALSAFFKFDVISLQILDERKKELNFKAVSGHGSHAGTISQSDIQIIHPKLNYGNCLSVKAFVDNQVVYIPELSNQMELSYIDKNILEIIGFKSLIYVPLSVQDKKVGVIGFYNKTKMVLTERTINTIRLQLSNVAIIINNLISYEDTKNK